MVGWQPDGGNNVGISSGWAGCVAYVLLRLIENWCTVEPCRAGCYCTYTVFKPYAACKLLLAEGSLHTLWLSWTAAEELPFNSKLDWMLLCDVWHNAFSFLSCFKPCTGFDTVQLWDGLGKNVWNGFFFVCVCVSKQGRSVCFLPVLSEWFCAGHCKEDVC